MMGKYYSEHELLNNMYDIVDEDGCILTVLDKDTLKTLPPLMPVRQPVHAHWIDDGWYADYHPHKVYRCSNCDWCELGVDFPEAKYCPHCGAKMDEKVE